MITLDPQNPRAVAFREELVRRVPEDIGGDDLVIVIGGDGFLLQTVARLGLARRYLGINSGHLGFLLNDVDDWDRLAERLVGGRFEETRFPVLSATMHRANGETVEDFAINDVYLERMTSQTARLRVSIDGVTVVDPLVADGVILSTAVGSTAYAFSAGGPAIHPALRVIGVTPICPHQPRLSSMVLPASSAVAVFAQEPDRRPVRCVADGRGVDAIVRVDVRLGPAEATLCHLEGHQPTTRMVRKLAGG